MTNEDILKYSSYIYGIAKYFKNYKNKDDLYQAGYIGLINAYNNYTDKGAKFTTYAYPYILGEMYKLVNDDKGIKICNNLKKLNLKIEKARIVLAQKYNRYPTTKELSEYLEIDEIEIIESIKSCNPIMSMDYEITTNDKPISLEETISSRELDIDTLLSLKNELSNLTEQEKFILESNINNYSQEEIASILGINQVKVSRTLSKVKEKIRQNVA